jgi:hypothetical protein
MKFKESLYEMANIRPNVTGLPMVIWIQPFTGKEKHGPRIKVQKKHGSKVNTTNWVTVSISKLPEIKDGLLSKENFKLVSKWIILNLKGLRDVWNDKITPSKFEYEKMVSI